MIFVLLFQAVNLAVGAVANTIETAFSLLDPTSVQTYWSSVDAIFSGIRALDLFIPVSELIVMASFGLFLNLILGIFVNGWGVGRMIFTLVFFWKR